MRTWPPARPTCSLGELLDQAFTLLPRERSSWRPHCAEVQAAFAGWPCSRASSRPRTRPICRRPIWRAGPSRADYLREVGEGAVVDEPPRRRPWRSGTAASGSTRDDQDLRARLGMALLELGQNPEAAPDRSSTPPRRFPATELLPASLPEPRLAVDRLDRASAHLQTAIELNPGDAEVALYVWRVRDRQGRPEAAPQFYRQAARVDPGEGRYLAAAADASTATGKRPEALEVMKRPCSLSPDSGEVKPARRRVVPARAAAPLEALHRFKQCVGAQPRDPLAHLALARGLVTGREDGDREGRTGHEVAVADRA